MRVEKRSRAERDVRSVTREASILTWRTGRHALAIYGLSLMVWLLAAGGAQALAAPADSARAAPEDSAARAAAALELLHLTPASQPPMDVLDFDNFDEMKSAFNDASDRTRVVLMVSPSCPHCLQGASAIQQVLTDHAATPMRIIVVWMRVTHSDRAAPNSLVLARVSDRRAIQFWDPNRMVSRAMLTQLPPDTAIAMADTSGNTPPVIWDLIAMWRPGVVWTDRVPVPDFEGHPIVSAVETFRRRLGELARAKPSAK